MKKLFLCLISVFLSTPTALAIPQFSDRQVQGLNIKVPQGWQIESDEYSIQLFANPNNPDAATLGLIAVTANQAMQITPREISNAIIQEIQQSEPQTQMQLVDENENTNALYQLYQLQDTQQTGYLSTYTYTDQASGSMVYVFFTALENDFVELGGPALPLVVFAGLNPQPVANIQQQVQQTQYDNMTADQYEMLSRISAMSHESTMKILYNMDSGWCYRGEPNCY